MPSSQSIAEPKGGLCCVRVKRDREPFARRPMMIGNGVFPGWIRLKQIVIATMLRVLVGNLAFEPHRGVGWCASE
jgi:hypothetical protein